jgi:S-adenosylmethionine hydrolase
MKQFGASGSSRIGLWGSPWYPGEASAKNQLTSSEMQSMPPLVTLTSDFGQREPFVAEIKGILHSGCPGTQVVDLSHEIDRGDVMEAAFFVLRSIPRFPKGTIHLVNVAPGPAPIVISVLGQQVVCPDNGLLTMLSQHHDIEAIHSIAAPEAVSAQPGQTFFGRDIFAPAAVRLANGSNPAELGEPMENMVLLEVPRMERVNEETISGRTIHVDRFGNLVTNIHANDIDDCEVRHIVVGDFPIHGLSQSYSEVPPGKPLALLGSAGYLEIAYNQDRAVSRLQFGRGIIVRVTVEPK